MLILFAVGSALGAVARFAVERFSTRHYGEKFPYGTLFVNILGSLLLGWAFDSSYDANFVYFGLAFCGAFTTFGGFIGQTHSRLRHRDTRVVAITYLTASVVGSVLAAWIGLQLP